MFAPLTEDERGFIRAILDHPDELMTWLAYADWLDDRGDPRSEFLRLTAERRLSPTGTSREHIDARLEELWEVLDPKWMLVFDTGRVWNCRNSGWTTSGCSRNTWDTLASTDNPEIRICRPCNAPVFFCVTVDEAMSFVSCGQIVALAARTPQAQLPNVPAFQAPDDHDPDLDYGDEFGDPDTLGE